MTPMPFNQMLENIATSSSLIASEASKHIFGIATLKDVGVQGPLADNVGVFITLNDVLNIFKNIFNF